MPKLPIEAFKRLKSQVEGTATVMAQLNEVARFLAGHGYKDSHKPEAREQWASTKPGERPARIQFYIWLDTPFGDDVVLSTGPSFKPALALGSEIPREPGVGVYVASVLTQLKRKTTDAMQRAEAKGPRRQETFAEEKARKAAPAKVAKPVERAAPKPVERAAPKPVERAAPKPVERRPARPSPAQVAAKAAEEAAAKARAEADRVAREAKAQGEREAARVAEAAKAEAADFLRFLEAQAEA